jgi:hypothetical protein
VTVQGTTLELPPSQPNGGGLNSSLSADTVTLAGPVASRRLMRLITTRKLNARGACARRKLLLVFPALFEL